MTGMLHKLDSFAGRGTRWCALAGLVCLVAVAMVTIVDVLVRWLFNSPIDGVEEVSRLVVAIIIASFFPLALAERHNIAIKFLGNALGPRARVWLETFAALVTTLFFVVVGWQFIHYTADIESGGETTWLLGWPVAPWWRVATAFLLLCIPVQLVVFAILVRAAIRGEPDKAPYGTTPEEVSPTDGEY